MAIVDLLFELIPGRSGSCALSTSKNIWQVKPWAFAFEGCIISNLILSYLILSYLFDPLIYLSLSSHFAHKLYDPFLSSTSETCHRLAESVTPRRPMSRWGSTGTSFTASFRWRVKSEASHFGTATIGPLALWFFDVLRPGDSLVNQQKRYNCIKRCNLQIGFCQANEITWVKPTWSSCLHMSCWYKKPPPT